LITPQVLVPAVLVPLVGYRLYMRFRANVGRQTLQPQRIAIRLALLLLVIGLFAWAALQSTLHSPTHSAALLEALVGGLIAGAAIAMLGLSLTQFSSDEKGRYYTPNLYIGAAVTLLLVGRIVYRMTVMFTMPQMAAPPGSADPFASMAQSPLTLALLMLTLGYYLTFSAGVLLKSRALAAPATAGSPPSNPA